MSTYLVVIENESHQFRAFSPDVPGCEASGKSIAEAIKEMKTALEKHMKTIKTKPLPKGLNHYMNQGHFKKGSSDYITQVTLN